MSTPTRQGASPDLSALGAGFADESRGSQAVFRHVLQALSHPGQPVLVGGDAEWPVVPGAACHPASAAVLLALLDAETTLWLSPALVGSAAETWLRFHTGCTVVAEPNQAHFVWAASLAELPDLSRLHVGTDVSPETAATCVVDVPDLCAHANGAQWALGGPGIRTQAHLALPGVADAEVKRFDALRRTSHALFPRGVDVLLTTATHVLGLPRTTRLTRCAASATARTEQEA
jgi:alpha-D-ribose 1-methylphosphonate 5-triphosphate synthase subunit PhnH